MIGYSYGRPARPGFEHAPGPPAMTSAYRGGTAAAGPFQFYATSALPAATQLPALWPATSPWIGLSTCTPAAASVPVRDAVPSPAAPSRMVPSVITAPSPAVPSVTTSNPSEAISIGSEITFVPAPRPPVVPPALSTAGTSTCLSGVSWSVAASSSQASYPIVSSQASYPIASSQASYPIASSQGSEITFVPSPQAGGAPVQVLRPSGSEAMASGCSVTFVPSPQAGGAPVPVLLPSGCSEAMPSSVSEAPQQFHQLLLPSSVSEAMATSFAALPAPLVPTADISEIPSAASESTPTRNTPVKMRSRCGCW